MLIFSYRVISYFFLIISPLIIIFRIFKKKESIFRFLERYGFYSQPRKKGRLIWFHCSSVGELLSVVPLIERFETQKKIHQILVTTTTLSSSKIFQKLKLKKTIHQFFPIDNKLIIKKFINYWKPEVFFLCESEIWPNLIHFISKKKIRMILINARMSLKSFNRWYLIKYSSKEIFKQFDLCFSQNKETFKRLKLLGVKKIYNIGNLKFATRKRVRTEVLEKNTIDFFKRKRILVTAASTHFNEEDFVIKNHLYFKNKKDFKNAISIIVPRHAERSKEIKDEVEKYSLKAHLRSSGNKIDSDVDIYIADTYGELNKIYKISNIVFMGGSLINHGGQNPLEPAKLGCYIIHGPSTYNFKEIYNHLKSNNMSAVFKNYVEGTNILNKLLFKKRLSNKNKKLLEYGKKILNLTYLEIAKFI